jgi:hypothetical protein
METGKEFERENENDYNYCRGGYDDWGHFIDLDLDLDLDLEYTGNQDNSSVSLKIRQEICVNDGNCNDCGKGDDCEFIAGDSKKNELFIRFCIICVAGLYLVSLSL